MRIAFLIAAHTDPDHLERLINVLFVDGITDFFIHIDKKSDITKFKHLENFNGIKLSDKRIYTTWAGSSQCRYQISLVDEVYKTGKVYDRVFFLSGQDYPIISIKEIIKSLEKNHDKEYICGLNITRQKSPHLKKINQYHFFRNLKAPYLLRRILIRISRDIMGLFPKRNPFFIHKNVRHDIYYGSSWFCLTWDCFKYIKTQLEDGEIFKFFKYAYAPDEMMIHTIVFNSAFKKNAFEILDIKASLPDLTPLHYIEYPPEGIKIFDEKDYETLISSRKWFFRKAITGHSDKLIEKINNFHHQ